MKKILFLFLISMVYLQTFAVPAYPYPVTITQPNGEELTLIMKGDEYMNWAVTLDGYTLLVNSDSYFCYAQLNASGDLVPSQYHATEILNRSGEVNTWLQSINTNLFYSDIQVFNYMQLREIVATEYEKGEDIETKGERKLLVILAEFPDRSFKRTAEDFELLMNQINYTDGGLSGSVKDYFLENSYGQLDLTCNIVGPFELPNNATYYALETRWGLFARNAITAAIQGGVSLAPFATGYTVSSVYLIYAGFDASAGCPQTQCIWAHAQRYFNYLEPESGYTIQRYAASSELRGVGGSTLTDIGVICHEYGHTLGAPDYYDTNGQTGGDYDGTGNWDLQAGGSWNNGGTTPPHSNPRSKINTYDWATATLLNTPQTVTVPISRIYNNAFFKISIPNSDSFSADQYFVIENRTREGFDSYIPGQNLIIYRCTENYESQLYLQNTTSPQRFYPVSANASVAVPAFGSSAKSQYGNINSSSATWPGTLNKALFHNSTTPAMVSWGGTPCNKPISNITVHGDYITFDYIGGGSKSNYLVFLPYYYGTIITAQSGSSSPVNVGGNFSFTVDLFPSHNKSKLVVTANNIPLTPSGNIYTISNIQSDQIVRIEGLEFNTFPITATAGINGNILPEGVTEVNYGGIKTFEIRADNGCSVDKVFVDDEDMGEIKSYTFKNVLKSHTINATFKLGGQYSILTSCTGPLYFETVAGAPSEYEVCVVSSPDIVANISVAAPPKFQISLNGITWYQNFSISRTQIPANLYIRFNPAPGDVGEFKGTLTLKSTEAYNEIELIGNALVGINESDNIQNISIYPNPTTGELKIESGELRVENIDIFDNYGRKQKIIINYQLSNVNSINISHLQAGIYFLAIATDQGIVYKKVVKE